MFKYHILTSFSFVDRRKGMESYSVFVKFDTQKKKYWIDLPLEERRLTVIVVVFLLILPPTSEEVHFITLKLQQNRVRKQSSFLI